MAQLRRDHAEFVERDTAVVVAGSDNAAKFNAYFTKNDLPFIGVPDPKHSILKLYGQEVKIFKLGRMPAQVLIDKAGVARFVHYGSSMSDIPATQEMLELIDELNAQVETT
jgi:peroxiredoxin